MITIRVCTTIVRPLATVWAAVERIESHAEWMQDAERIWFEGDQREGVGTRFACLTRVGPLSTTDHFVVTRWEPPTLMAIEHVGAVKGDADFRLRDRGGDRTEFCWEERLRFPWWLAGRVGEQVGRPVLRRIWEGNVRRLRAMIEGTDGGARRAPAPTERGESMSEATTVEDLPQVEGPVSGGQGILIAGTGFDLAAHGYTEDEYFVTGTATAYTRDEQGVARPDTTADYRTRIVVYRPADASRFDGTVCVEWLNVSGGIDGAPDWTFLHREVMRTGAAYVAVSAQAVGVVGGESLMGMGDMSLVNTDPARYGSLVHPGDRYSFDLFTQAGRIARTGAGTSLEGLPIERVLAVGESQSAFRLTTYVNDVDPLVQVFDGFLVHARGGTAPPLDVDGVAGVREGDPVRFRDDLRVPVLCVEAETDLFALGYLAARQDDAERFRLWEVAGLSHADIYTFAVGRIDSGTLPIEELADAWRPTTELITGTLDQPVNTGPQRYVLAAALRHLVRWVRDGTPPPSAPRLEVRDGAEGPELVVDDLGLARGGVRTPHVDVPVAVLTGMGNSGSPVAFLAGCTLPFDEASLRELYGTRDAYVEQFRAATDAAVEAGFVLADDAEEIVAVATHNYPAPT